MVMFSELRRFRLRDSSGRQARLRDLAVDLSAHDYPPTTHVIFRTLPTRRSHLAWAAVQKLDVARRVITVEDLSQATSSADDPLEKAVLLDRDVLDALILDLPNRQSMRANDLWLEEHDGRLELRAADIGVWAILRRLGRGLLGQSSQRRLLDWQDVEFLRGDPHAAREGRDYHRRVAFLQPSEIARLLDALPYLHAAELLELLDENVAADTLEVMRPERQVQVFDEFEQPRRLRLVELMAPDNAADLLGRLGPGRARELLEKLPSPHRERIVALLRYPDDSAGGIMTNDVVLVESSLTVGQARESIRERLRSPDFVYYVYVVDDLDSRHLAGVLTLRDLLVADTDEDVRRVMRRDVATLDPEMTADAAARRVAEQHLAALPVVDKEGHVVGAVTSDAALIRMSPPSMSGDEPRVFT